MQHIQGTLYMQHALINVTVMQLNCGFVGLNREGKGGVFNMIFYYFTFFFCFCFGKSCGVFVGSHARCSKCFHKFFTLLHTVMSLSLLQLMLFLVVNGFCCYFLFFFVLLLFLLLMLLQCNNIYNDCSEHPKRAGIKRGTQQLLLHK